MKPSVLRRFWFWVTGPFVLAWIVCRTASRGYRRSADSRIPFLHAWHMEIQDWISRLEEEKRTLDEGAQRLQREHQEAKRLLDEAKKEADRKITFLNQEIDRLGPEGVIQLGQELEAREKKEQALTDSQNGASMKTEGKE